MPFIGNQPALSYTSFAKQDFTTSATTSYTLDHPVTNENEIALFINFVRQEPTTAYTASGTSLTLTSATSASDDMYCVFLGKAVQTVNPPNGSVGASQLADGSIALGKLSATGTKDSTTFLRGDNSFDVPPLGGITMADQFCLTSSFGGSATPIASNLARVARTGQGTLNGGMTESSGIFTFPSTGIYLVNFTASFQLNGDSRYIFITMQATTDNSSYSAVAETPTFIQQTSSSTTYAQAQCSSLIDVTDTSNVKVRFNVGPLNSSVTTRGEAVSATYMQFIRLGDT